MKKLALTLILVLGLPILAAQGPSAVFITSRDFTDTSGTVGINIAGRGLGYHAYNWSVQRGSLSSCTFTMQSSYDGVTWTDVSGTSASCTAGGFSGAIQLAANWIRFKASVFTGTSSPLVTVNYRGITDSFTVPSNLTQVYDIRNYGAKCDGSTNDSVAITNADSAALTANSYLYIPAGATNCRTNSVTILAKLAYNSGIIAVNAGQTVTFAAPPTHLGPVKLFENVGWTVASTHGSIAFSAGGKIFPEWFGCKNDGTSQSVACVRAASQSMPLNSELAFSEGIYNFTGSCLDTNLGSDANRWGPIVIPENSSVTGKGIGKTLIKYLGDTWGTANAGCRAFIINRPFTANKKNFTVKGITFEDTRANRTCGDCFFFSGTDTISFTGENVWIQENEFYNGSGNGPVHLFPSSASAVNPNGSNFFITDNIFHNDADGNHTGFSAINTSSCLSNAHMERNWIYGNWATGSGFVGDCVPVAGQPPGIGNYYIGNIIDMYDWQPPGNSDCIGAGPAQGIVIEDNICYISPSKVFPGINLQGEVSVASRNVHYNVRIANNYVGPKKGDTLTGGNAPIMLRGYDNSEITVTGNVVYGAYIIQVSEDCTGDDGPGVGNVMIANNIFYRTAGDTNAAIVASGGTAPCTYTGKTFSVHDNQIYHTSGAGSTYLFANSAGVSKIRDAATFWNNTCAPVLRCGASMVGAPIVLSGATITNGSNGTFTATATGVFGPEHYRVAGLYDFTTDLWKPIPSGVVITITTSATDTVAAFITNNSGSSVTLDNSGSGGIGKIIVTPERLQK